MRGCQHLEERKTLIEDCQKYELQIFAVSETRIAGTSLEQHVTSDKDNTTTKYAFFHTGSDDNTHHGEGLIIDQDLSPTFKRISDRICAASINLVNHKLIVISAYAPTLEVSEANPEVRELFYSQLDSTVSTVASRDACVVLGDFNAKTGSGWRDFPDNIGRFGKGHVNENGHALLEFTAKNDIVLTNTLFSHKLCHRTTWAAPERHHTSAKDDQGNPQLLLGPDNLPRREPFRNQIDYIATKIKHRKCVTNSRSYGGIKSYTDHKLVNMSMNFQWHKLRKQKQRTNMTDITNFSDREKQTLYNQEIHKKISAISGH